MANKGAPPDLDEAFKELITKTVGRIGAKKKQPKSADETGAFPTSEINQTDTESADKPKSYRYMLYIVIAAAILGLFGDNILSALKTVSPIFDSVLMTSTDTTTSNSPTGDNASNKKSIITQVSDFFGGINMFESMSFAYAHLFASFHKMKRM